MDPQFINSVARNGISGDASIKVLIKLYKQQQAKIDEAAN
jgi:hypothetical protein